MSYCTISYYIYIYSDIHSILYMILYMILDMQIDIFCPVQLSTTETATRNTRSRANFFQEPEPGSVVRPAPMPYTIGFVGDETHIFGTLQWGKKIGNWYSWIFCRNYVKPTTTHIYIIYTPAMFGRGGSASSLPMQALHQNLAARLRYVSSTF